MRQSGYLFAASALAIIAVSSPSIAGGFQRGTADTDILFDQATFATRFGVTYVNPNRGFSSINGVSGDYANYTDDYAVPSGAVYFGGDVFGCAGTYTISFAASADYSGSPGGSLPVDPATPSRSRIIDSSFSSNEFGMTCRASYSTDSGRFSFLGGIFAEDFSFNGTSVGTTLAGPLVNLGFGPTQPFIQASVDGESDSDYKAGYRLGAAYELPDIALRAQVLYRSAVSHDPVGTGVASSASNVFVINPRNGQAIELPSASPAIGTPLASGINTLTEVTSPQSLTISAQTGIADKTLLLASFRWTDWSTNGVVRSTFTSAAGSSFSQQPYNWDDGYTVSLGIGRAFTDTISGAVAIGYDSGVSTGSDTTYTDLYTLSAGVSLKPDKWGEIRFGGLIGYWTSGNQSIADGAYFNAHVDDTIVLAGTASLKFTF